MPIKITIDRATSERSSQGSSLTDEEDSSGTGVQVDSPTSAVGSQEYSDSLEESERWQVLQTADPDEIGPSESASRPRTSNHHRPIVEPPRPELAHRQSARRQVSYDHHHHSLPRTHRQPPLAAPESVDSNEEYAAGYARGPAPHHSRFYQHWGHAGSPSANYAPSYSSSQPYSPFPTTSIVPAGQQLTPFVSPGPYAFPPYQSAPGGAAPGYFTSGHHGGAAMGNPMGPQSGAAYGGQEMMHPGPGAAYYPYSAQAYPMPQAMAPPPMYPPYAVYSSPAPAPAPAPLPAPAAAATPPPPAPPPDNSKVDENFARLEKLFLDQKAEQEAKEAAAKKAAEDAAAKAESDKKIAEDIAAAAAAAAAAATEEAEKKAADEKAKEKAEAEAAAEKAAKEAADKKAIEEAAAAAAAAAVPPPPPPPPEEKKKPIKFKDAVGRKFSFPFHLCNTWSGMEDLIRQAFLHVEIIGPHVAEGHYDLVGTNGEIILPQVWGTVIEPDTTITMHMWPMPEPPKVEEPPPESVTEVVVVPEPKKDDPGKKKKPLKPKQTTSIGWFAGRPAKPKAKASKGVKKGAEAVPPAPPPPPPAPPVP